MLYHSKSRGPIEIEKMAVPHRINAAIKIMQSLDVDFSIKEDTDQLTKIFGASFKLDDCVDIARLVFKDTKIYLRQAQVALSMVDKSNENYELLSELLNINLEDIDGA